MIKIEERQKLLEVAKIIASAETQSATISSSQAEEFAPLARSNFISIEEDQISFSTPELLRSWIVQFRAMCISDAWEDLDQTAIELLISYRLFQKLHLSKSTTAELFLLLNHHFGKDILNRMVEASHLDINAHEANTVLNSIYFNFCDVLPELDYSPDVLASKLEPVFIATFNYFPPGRLHSAIERLAAQSLQKAEALVAAFLKNPQKRTIELAANSLKSLWKFHSDQAFRKAIHLAMENSISIQRVGVISLAWFDYELPLHEEKLSETIRRLEDLSESANKTLLSTIAQALGELIVTLPQGSHLKQLQKKFLELASLRNPDVQSAVVQTLNKRIAAELGDVDLLWNSLNKLSEIPPDRLDILPELDLITYRITQSNPQRVLKYFEEVVISKQHILSSDIYKLSQIYPDTIYALWGKQQALAETTVTRWFASKDRHLHMAASDLVECFVLQHQKDHKFSIQLDSSVLNQLNNIDVQRIICGLTGYVNDYHILTSLLLSVLTKEKYSQRIRELILNALEQVVLYNMPTAIRPYIDKLSEESDIPNHISQVIKDALDAFDSYDQSFRNKPILKELSPPNQHRNSFDRKLNKYVNNFFNRNEIDESGFLGHIPKIPVKYGQASYSLESDNTQSSVPLTPISTEIDIPRELIIDPLGYKIKRMQWRQMAIHGIPKISNTHNEDH
ncbi:MAG: hypothetical protein OXF08_00815 [Bacteroidetes bacterium]|nr:hypothetical protein [Bacteroidota bacterium]